MTEMRERETEREGPLKQRGGRTEELLQDTRYGNRNIRLMRSQEGKSDGLLYKGVQQKDNERSFRSNTKLGLSGLPP